MHAPLSVTALGVLYCLCMYKWFPASVHCNVYSCIELKYTCSIHYVYVHVHVHQWFPQDKRKEGWGRYPECEILPGCLVQVHTCTCTCVHPLQCSCTETDLSNFYLILVLGYALVYVINFGIVKVGERGQNGGGLPPFRENPVHTCVYMCSLQSYM